MKLTAITFTEFCAKVLRVKLTKAQWVFCRVVFDRVDPIDLGEEYRELSIAIFGNVARFPAHCRGVLAWLKGARLGGSYLSALFMLYLGLTLPLDSLAPGEIAFGNVTAPDVKTGRQALRFIAGAVRLVPDLRRLIEADSSDFLTLKRPDGRIVSFEVTAASRGGATQRGRSYFAGLLDESSFFYDTNYTVNDLEIYRALSPRIIPGGMLLVISTAFAEAGLLWDKVEKNHGNPVDCIAAITPTLLMLPTDRNKQAYAEEHERDPQNADREFNCIPLEQGAGRFFDGTSIANAIDHTLPIVILPSQVSA